jgi:hypothetical protein
MLYKESLNEDLDFETLLLNPCGRGRRLSFGSIPQPRLYVGQRPVTALKKRDMMDLLPYIPPVHHGFFERLKVDTAIDDQGPLSSDESDVDDVE